MANLKATKVPEVVSRSTLNPELEAWLKGGCPTLGGHMPVEEMRREHQALVPDGKVDVQVCLASAEACCFGQAYVWLPLSDAVEP